MGNGHVKKGCSEHVCSDSTPYKFHRDWMKHIDGEKYLGQISIPGTHDSFALHGEPIIMTAKAQCQSWSFENQLLGGIRIFDCRMKLRNQSTQLVAYHGMINQKVDINHIFEVSYRFLKENPSETILLKLKHEGMKGIKIPTCFQYVFQSELQAFCERPEIKRGGKKLKDWWFFEPRIPQLKEVRGKVVLLRQFHGDIGFQFCSNRQVKSQCNFKQKTSIIKQKISGHQRLMQETSSMQRVDEGEQFFVNMFNKGATFLKNPHDYSKRINHHVYNLQGFLGIILLDFPGEQIIQYIINQNHHHHHSNKNDSMEPKIKQYQIQQNDCKSPNNNNGEHSSKSVDSEKDNSIELKKNLIDSVQNEIQMTDLVRKHTSSTVKLNTIESSDGI